MPFFPFFTLCTYARLDNRRVLTLVLILRDYNIPEEGSFEEWSAILDLSTRWGFTSIRNLAIRCTKPPNPLDRLLLARKHAVEAWTLPALLELCSRPEPLSLEEARRMDFEDVLLVGSVRQSVRSSALTVDGTAIGNLVRAWKSGQPGGSVPEPTNNPVQIHLPQSDTLPTTLKPTGQSILKGGSVSTEPTCAEDEEWARPATVSKKKKGIKNIKKDRLWDRYSTP
jgi:hypothetical protein